jgi:hypothetical protein
MNENLIPQNVKEYLKSPKRIIKVIPNNNYTLTVLFDNNETRIYDMSNDLFGVFEILKNLDKFKQVFIDESGNVAWDRDSTIDSSMVWNNRIDICKDSIYLDSKPINPALSAKS